MGSRGRYCVSEEYRARDRRLRGLTVGGYGAEIAAAIADECYAWLDAPVRRVASTDTFVGYAPRPEDAILPQANDFKRAYEEIVKF